MLAYQQCLHLTLLRLVLATSFNIHEIILRRVYDLIQAASIFSTCITVIPVDCIELAFDSLSAICIS